MATDRINDAPTVRPGRLLLADLEDYADELNRRNFSRHYGWHWFVASRRLDDGTIQHYIDRREADHARQRWRPGEGEVAAIKARAAGRFDDVDHQTYSR